MRGTLVERLRKCGRPNCACAKDPAARHGGLFLTVSLCGKTQAIHVRPEDEPRVRAAIAAYHELWEVINGLTECEIASLKQEIKARKRSRVKE
jgi:hypothetical protein